MVIISAMGKTTNALEKVVEAFYEGKKEEALQLFEQVKQQHLTTAKYLLVTHALACEKQLKDFFTEVEWLLHDKPVREYDYYYDQVVCVGELLSTAIISHYLNETGISNKWMDVRDIIRTDDNFRDANIDWEYTQVKSSKLRLCRSLKASEFFLHRDLLGLLMKMKALRWEEKEVITQLLFLPICWMQKARPSGKMWKV